MDEFGTLWCHYIGERRFCGISLWLFLQKLNEYGQFYVKTCLLRYNIAHFSWLSISKPWDVPNTSRNLEKVYRCAIGGRSVKKISTYQIQECIFKRWYDMYHITCIIDNQLSTTSALKLRHTKSSTLSKVTSQLPSINYKHFSTKYTSTYIVAT